MKFPNPERFEPEPKEYVPFKMKKVIRALYRGHQPLCLRLHRLFASSSCTSRAPTRSLPPALRETTALVSSGSLPLLYAGAMLVDAVAALVFGMMYDKKGVQRARVVHASLCPVCRVRRSRATACRCCCLRRRALGRRHGRAGVDPEGRGHAAWCQRPAAPPATALFECSFGVFWFLGQLAARRAVRCQCPGDGSGVGRLRSLRRSRSTLPRRSYTSECPSAGISLPAEVKKGGALILRDSTFFHVLPLHSAGSDHIIVIRHPRAADPRACTDQDIY